MSFSRPLGDVDPSAEMLQETHRDQYTLFSSHMWIKTVKAMQDSPCTDRKGPGRVCWMHGREDGMDTAYAQPSPVEFLPDLALCPVLH